MLMLQTLSPKILLTLSASIVSSFLIWKLLSSKKIKLPPGPRGWPLVGCIHLLSPDFYIKLAKLKKFYGNIFSFYIGNRLTVVLCDTQAVREAFINQSVTFAGRPNPWVMQLINVKEFINNGTYNEEWREEKKFVLSALRQFGYGTNGLTDRIIAEINNLLETYSEAAKSKMPVNPREHMPKTMANLIFSILINERYDYDDPRLEEKLTLIGKWQNQVGEANLLDVIPMLRFIPWKPMRKLKKVRDEIVSMYRQHVVEHKNSFDPNHIRDVIDVFLQERGLDFDEERLIGLFFSFAGDATDSLPEVMVWIVLFICSFPELQRKLQEEIDEVTGGLRRAELEDRRSMPLTEATIMEGLRYSSFVPLSEPHCTLDDTKLLGFDIPKGCTVLANLYSVHFDEKYWNDPLTFNPMRFIDDEGKLKKFEALMPYSVGRRMCLADQLSNKVLFLFLSHLIGTFNVTFSDEDNKPNLQPGRWYVRKAQDFSIHLTHRS